MIVDLPAELILPPGAGISAPRRPARLDCGEARPQLRSMLENCGFEPVRPERKGEVSVADRRQGNRRDILTAFASALTAAVWGGAATACAQAGSRAPVLRSSAFGSFGDAVAEWSRSGGTLIVDVDHIETSPVTMVCIPGLGYRLTTDGPRTIAYDGPQYHWFLCIYSEGRNPFVIDGSLTVDGRDKCCMPVFVRFEHVAGDARRDFSVAGLTASNARMRKGASSIDGSRTNAYGATAMHFFGGFDHLELRRVSAQNVTREAGAGLAGSRGCVGIAVTSLTGDRSARHIRIYEFEVARVDSDDPPGSGSRTDMDGVLVFQSAEEGGSPPVIERGTIREAAGRAIKVFAPGGGGVTRDITVYRSVHGSTQGSNDVAHQHGDGTIERITFHYSGDANASPTTPVGLSTGHLRAPGFPFQRGVVRNIAIHDTTGQPKYAIVTLFSNLRDVTPRSYRLSDIRDTGSAAHFLMPGSLGTFSAASIEIDQIDVNLTTSVMATEDPNPLLRVTARHMVNRSPRAVPFNVYYDGRAAPGLGGSVVADLTVRGVLR